MALAKHIGSTLALGAAAVWLLAGCDVPTDEPDAGNAEVDAAVDAGASDQGSVDAAGSDHATGRDSASGHDSAVGHDARRPDTGPRDQGLTPLDATAPEDAGSSDAGSTGVELNPSWVGGACVDEGSCTDSHFTAAICETDGFPGGMCTQACTQGTTTWTCPDSSGSLITTTRCVDANGQPRCASECDFAASPDTGCRPGYSCVLRQRYANASSIFAVCLPASTQGWPGESAPGFDIGAACSGPTDCNHLACLGLTGGYCSKLMCDSTGCPAGSSCFHLTDLAVDACLKDCSSPSNCRTSEGYTCDSGFEICWVDSAGGRWNPTVGATDCATAWSVGLSPCDTVPDDYIVVHKSARNMALCDSGSLVANWEVGLSSFAPTGDKQEEGDGKTPEGVFYAAQKIPTSSYYKAYLISYPDSADADRGLSGGLIDQSEHDAITAAQEGCTTPPQTTQLGSYVEVHAGYADAGESDWTLGCVAINNGNMDVLWSVLDVNETIVIVP
jgi:hypothetical protein